MSDFTKIILIITVVLGIIALMMYAYLSSEKLDDQKVEKVDSNIVEHLNNDLEELYDNNAEPEEDFVENIAEDDDFEEYIEPEEEDWVEEDTIAETAKPVVKPIDKSLPFLLIAGSYKSQENADTKVKKMERLGLETEILQFDDSDLFSVCIGRFKTESEAKQSREKFKTDLQVKSYIHKKRD